MTFESDARRRGELRTGDPLISPRAVREDETLARGSVLQRGVVELLPSAAYGALLMRVERRVNSDRTFENFGQVQDEKSATARWRTRLSPQFGTELELRARRREVSQALLGGGAFERSLEDEGGTAQGIFTPGSWLRAAAIVEASWSRPEGAIERSQVLRVGPDFGVALGTRGRLESGFRRTFASGPPALDLLPTADPLADQLWEANARIDWRLHESVTFSTSAQVRDRIGRSLLTTGRAELRAFF